MCRRRGWRYRPARRSVVRDAHHCVRSAGRGVGAGPTQRREGRAHAPLCAGLAVALIDSATAPPTGAVLTGLRRGPPAPGRWWTGLSEVSSQMAVEWKTGTPASGLWRPAGDPGWGLRRTVKAADIGSSARRPVITPAGGSVIIPAQPDVGGGRVPDRARSGRLLHRPAKGVWGSRALDRLRGRASNRPQRSSRGPTARWALDQPRAYTSTVELDSEVSQSKR